MPCFILFAIRHHSRDVMCISNPFLNSSCMHFLPIQVTLDLRMVLRTDGVAPLVDAPIWWAHRFLFFFASPPVILITTKIIHAFASSSSNLSTSATLRIYRRIGNNRPRIKTPFLLVNGAQLLTAHECSVLNLSPFLAQVHSNSPYRLKKE